MRQQKCCTSHLIKSLLMWNLFKICSIYSYYSIQGCINSGTGAQGAANRKSYPWQQGEMGVMTDVCV